MRISVHCRGRTEKKPCSFCLGQAQHRVVAILAERDENDRHCYEVRVLDGRRFVLCRRLEGDTWELAAVYRRGSRPAVQPRPAPLAAPPEPQAVRPHRTALLLRKGWSALKHLAHHGGGPNRLPVSGAAA